MSVSPADFAIVMSMFSFFLIVTLGAYILGLIHGYERGYDDARHEVMDE